MFASILESLAEHPLPADDELDLWHEWHLRSLKGIRTLTRYLWRDAASANKAAARTLMEGFIRTVFAKTYLPSEGAFSYYPGGERATIDGLGGLFIYKEAGAFSAEKQARLWGAPMETITDLGVHAAARITDKDLAAIWPMPNF